MSRQKIDTITRKMISASNQFQRKNYKKTLKMLEEAEIAAREENVPDLIARALILKANVLETEHRIDDTLNIYDEAFTISSRLFLEDPDKYDYLMLLEGAVTGIMNTLQATGDIGQAIMICEKHEDTFLEVCDTLMQHDIGSDEDIDHHLSHVEALNHILICFGMARIPKIKVSYVLKVLEEYARISETDPEYVELETRLPKIARIYGDFFVFNDAPDDAEQVYDKLLELADRKYETDPDDLSNLVFRTKAQLLLGEYYTGYGRTDDAYAIFSGALEQLTSHCKEGHDNSICNFLIAKISQKTGLLLAEEDDYDQAGSYLEKALAGFEQIGELFPEYFLFEAEDIGIYEDMAEFFEDNEDIDKAERTYLLEIAIFEFLIDAGIEETDNRLFIAETYDQLAKLSGDDDFDKADDYFRKEIAMYRDLHEEYPDDSDYDEYIANVLVSLGDLYFDADYELSLKNYEGAVDIYAELMAQNESVENKYAVVLSKLAILHSAHKEYDRAISLLDQAVDILTGSSDTVTGHNRYRRELAGIYMTMANVYEEQDDTEKELQYFSKGIDNYSGILSDDDVDREAKLLLNVDMMLRESKYMHAGKYEMAKALAEPCYRFNQTLVENEPDDPVTRMLLLSCEQDLGVINYNLGFMDEAIEYYLKCLSNLEKVIEVQPDELLSLRTLALVNIRLGITYNVVGGLELSKQALERSMEVQAKLAEISTSAFTFDREWEITGLEEYAKVLAGLGKNDEAETYKAKAEEKRRICPEECAENQDDTDQDESRGK
ncbi:MAG: tetratricopeptide repeat protein [Methanolobus sp.]|nr:tetratricopeptide repeat protein [Methanolobus sp.]